MGSWGQVADIVFVFISAWFLADVRGIHLKKVLELVLQTWFYCMVILLIAIRRNPIIYFIAICLFYGFRKCRLGYHPYINKVAKATLGVYIIHENFLLSGGTGKSLLWDGMFHMGDAFLHDWYPVYLIGIVIVVFVVSTVIELIRLEVAKHCSMLECNSIKKICMKFDDWWVVK